MNKSMFDLLSVVAIQWALLPSLVVPAVLDVTITTRRTYDLQNASVNTTIVYLKGPRRRLDTIVEFPQVGNAARATRTVVGTRISQCDDRQLVLLNHEAKTYALLPIEAPSVELRRRRAASRPPQSEPDGGDVTITIDAVDTGERRTMGPYIARRVITTTTTAPGPGASALPSNQKQDGWYVDLPSTSCSDPGESRQSVLNTNVQRPNTPRDRVHINSLGTARRGFPIEETDHTTDEHGTITARIELIEFSQDVLNASLFTVPAEYRPALPTPFGGYDLSKPDTTMNRLRSYWEGLSIWADSRLRLVWR